MTEPVVQTRALTKRYGRVLAVSALSLTVPRGVVFGLLGPNGSGKTTTLGMILGLIRPTSGSMRIFDQDMDGAYRHEVLLRVGAIVETPAFYPYLSGHANLRFFQGIGRRGSPEDVGHLLELVGLSARADSKYGTYSLGMKQRLGIAYALLGEPELVILDEPTNGLDPAGMVEVRELILRLATGGRTIILSSHILNEVEQVCDHVAILSKGQLIAQGDVKDLLTQKGSVRLKTTNDPAAARVIASLPWVGGVQAEDGRLVVAAPAERSWELTQALAKHDVYVAEMAADQVSLERYFLDVTGATQSPEEKATP